MSSAGFGDPLHKVLADSVARLMTNDLNSSVKAEIYSRLGATPMSAEERLLVTNALEKKIKEFEEVAAANSKDVRFSRTIAELKLLQRTLVGPR